MKTCYPLFLALAATLTGAAFAVEPPIPKLPDYSGIGVLPPLGSVNPGEPEQMPEILLPDMSGNNPAVPALPVAGEPYGPNVAEKPTTYYYKLVESQTLDQEKKSQEEEIYLKVRFSKNSVEVSPAFESNIWETFEINNQDPSWKTVREDDVEIRKAVPTMRGISNTPESMAALLITEATIGIFRNSGKEGARYFHGGRIKPEVIAKIEEWNQRKNLAKNSTERAVITTVTLSNNPLR